MHRPATFTAEDLPRPAPGTFLVDSHCHLETEPFDGDRDEVIERAGKASVDTMITIGASGPFAANEVAVGIAERHAGVFATVGIHPHEASMLSDPLIERLVELARHERVVGIGESGLDYHYDHSPRDQQREAFRRFIDLAKRTDLPLSIHLRNADDDAAAILREEGLGDAGGVIHCFSSDTAAAKRFLDLGLHISFSGILTFKSADEIRAAAKIVPRDRLLVETDAPFLAPVPHRGKRNEPALVCHTSALLAEERSEPFQALVSTTAENAQRLFRL